MEFVQGPSFLYTHTLSRKEKHMRIFINPGHALGGRPDPGAVNYEHGVTEAAINARVAENARIALKSCGYETKVVQSHNLRGEAPGYPNVTGLANSWPADVFVSIHANAGGGRGCETYAFSTHSWGHALATTVQQTLWRAVSRIDKSFPNRGVKVNPDFTVLRRTAMPAILVETAFLDTEEDFQLLVSHAAVFGHAIANAIDQFLRAHITPEGDLIFEEDEPAPLMWRYVPAR